MNEFSITTDGRIVGLYEEVNSYNLKVVEKNTILRALEHETTLEDAAHILGINLSTLWRKRKEYGLI